MSRKSWVFVSLLVLFGICSLVVLQVRRSDQVDAYSGTGTGTALDPYLVTTCLQLAEVGAESGATYLQTANIDCTGTPVMIAGFTGTYDGGNFTISNISLTTNTIATGLFATTAGATIRNVHLSNVVVGDSTEADAPIGTLIGIMNGGTVLNSSAQGYITEVVHIPWSFNDSVGGLIGVAQGNAYISGSYASVNLNFGDELYGGGGFVGRTFDTVIIEDSYATGSVSSGIDSYMNGGFVGWQLGNSIIRRSYATGDVHVSIGGDPDNGDSYDTGGFVGSLNGPSWVTGAGSTATASIEDCYATGNVIVDGADNYDVGGFVGTIYDGASITRSYATGSVTSTLVAEAYGDAFAGFVGLTRNTGTANHPVISESYSTGAVQSTFDNNDVGGFVGEHRHGTIINSYTRSSVTVGRPGDEDQYKSSAGTFAGNLFAGTIVNSYAANEYRHYPTLGSLQPGFVGYKCSSSSCTGTVSSSYWDSDLSNNANTTNGGLPRSTAAMKTQSTFSGWDFASIWVIEPAYNDGYPGFQLYAPSPTPSPSASPSPAPSLSPSPLVPTNSPSVTPTVSTSLVPTASPSISGPTPSATVTPIPPASVIITLIPSITPQTSALVDTTVFPSLFGTLNPTITVSSTVDIEGTPSVPGLYCDAQFTQFVVSPTVARPGDTITIIWKTQQAQQVRYLEKNTILPEFGTIATVFSDSTAVTFIADAGDCISKKSQYVLITETPPWEVSTVAAVSALTVEAVTVPVTLSLQSLAQGSPTISRLDVQGNIWYALADFLERRRKKSIGYAYNAATKKPLSRVVLRLIEVQTKKVVDAVVTDARGVFRFYARAGQYVIQAVHPGFSFPSHIVKTDQDGSFGNVYMGEEFRIAADNDQIRISIPLDPIDSKELFMHFSSFKELLLMSMGILSQIIFYGGFVYSLYASMVYPHVFNFTVLAVYVVLLIIKVALYLSVPKTMGKVCNEEGQPLGGVELGLFDSEFNTLLYRTFTSKEGTYCFAVSPGVYYISIVDTRYSLRAQGRVTTSKRCEFKQRKGELQFVVEYLTAVKK